MPVMDWARSYLADEDARKECRPMQFDQQEGEVVFVPQLWGHAVLNLEPVLAISQQIGAFTGFYDEPMPSHGAGPRPGDGPGNGLGGGASANSVLGVSQNADAEAAECATDAAAGGAGTSTTLAEEQQQNQPSQPHGEQDAVAEGGGGGNTDAVVVLQAELDAMDMWFADMQGAMSENQDAIIADLLQGEPAE